MSLPASRWALRKRLAIMRTCVGLGVGVGVGVRVRVRIRSRVREGAGHDARRLGDDVPLGLGARCHVVHVALHLGTQLGLAWLGCGLELAQLGLGLAQLGLGLAC